MSNAFVGSRVIRDDRPAPRALYTSGGKEFAEDRWRDCILHFLRGLWSGDLDVACRPRIHFGEITLRLDEERGEYFAYGTSFETAAPDVADHEMIHALGSRLEVQHGLVCFVSNDRIKLLVIHLRVGTVCLWKKPWRSRFGISAHGIPSNVDGVTGTVSR